MFAAAKGERLDKAAVEQAVKRLGGVEDVASASDPFQTGAVSKDGRIAYTDLQFSVPQMEVGAAQTDAIEAAAHDAAPQVEYGGSAAAVESEPPIGEVLGVLVAMVVLAITFGSLLAAGLPLLTALFGVGVGMLGIQLASGVTDLTSTATTLAAMLGLAVGIDYALFILSRHRTQVRDGMRIADSIALATGTAGSAVVFAGSTVMIALVALVMTGDAVPGPDGHRRRGRDRDRGARQPHARPGAAGLRRRRACVRGKTFSAKVAEDAKPTLGARWVALVMRRPVVASGLVIVALGALAIPALDVRLGLPNDGTANPDTTARQAYDLVSEGFGVGVNGQLTIVVQGGDPRRRDRAALAALPDVAAVSPAQVIPGKDLALISRHPVQRPVVGGHREPRQRHPRHALRAATCS